MIVNTVFSASDLASLQSLVVACDCIVSVHFNFVDEFYKYFRRETWNLKAFNFCPKCVRTHLPASLILYPGPPLKEGGKGGRKGNGGD
jgi:hypothetical protein